MENEIKEAKSWLEGLLNETKCGRRIVSPAIEIQARELLGKLESKRVTSDCSDMTKLTKEAKARFDTDHKVAPALARTEDKTMDAFLLRYGHDLPSLLDEARKLVQIALVEEKSSELEPASRNVDGEAIFAMVDKYFSAWNGTDSKE